MTIRESLGKLWSTNEFGIIVNYLKEESKKLDSISYSLPGVDILNNVTTENKIVAEVLGKIIAKEVIDSIIYRVENYEKFFKK